MERAVPPKTAKELAKIAYNLRLRDHERPSPQPSAKGSDPSESGSEDVSYQSEWGTRDRADHFKST